MSTTKKEHISAASCCAQILWMNQTLMDFGMSYDHVPIKCDNTSVINLSKNPILHSRAKHKDIRHHFLRDHMQKGDIILEFVCINDQLDNIYTKPLSGERFYTIRRELNVIGEMRLHDTLDCSCAIMI